MVANMQRIENAARLAMADFGADSSTSAAQSGAAWTTGLGFALASFTVVGLIFVALL